ncbi:MAG: hypothetical protein KC877_03210 [Candidatus Kaiserbacteria bacterium]|nr:hypothetical protein [Candidatus Kaiserbacteria bacterium]MCB9816103.1 hypothetical protein [Candidatus Nomurabacteria bacterium]
MAHAAAVRKTQSTDRPQPDRRFIRSHIGLIERPSQVSDEKFDPEGGSYWQYGLPLGDEDRRKWCNHHLKKPLESFRTIGGTDENGEGIVYLVAFIEVWEKRIGGNTYKYVDIFRARPKQEPQGVFKVYRLAQNAPERGDGVFTYPSWGGMITFSKFGRSSK